MDETEAITAIKCDRCDRLQPLIAHRESYHPSIKAFFEIAKMNNIGFLCFECKAYPQGK